MNHDPVDLLNRATKAALTRRMGYYRLGAVGIRGRDQKIVTATNERNIERLWSIHAEARLCKKLTPDSIVAVARLLSDDSWAMSRPCESCQRLLKRVGVKVVYYTIGISEYGVLKL